MPHGCEDIEQRHKPHNDMSEVSGHLETDSRVTIDTKGSLKNASIRISDSITINANHYVSTRWGVQPVLRTAQNDEIFIGGDSFDSCDWIEPVLYVAMVSGNEYRVSHDRIPHVAELLGVSPLLSFDTAMKITRRAWTTDLDDLITWEKHWEKWQGFTQKCEKCGEEAPIEEVYSGLIWAFHFDKEFESIEQREAWAEMTGEIPVYSHVCVQCYLAFHKRLCIENPKDPVIMTTPFAPKS